MASLKAIPEPNPVKNEIITNQAVDWILSKNINGPRT